MVSTMEKVGTALKDIPCIGDGDTGFGNAVNVKRTVRGYTRAGLAGIMIEDQVAPKRCGHTRGKDVVDRAEAVRTSPVGSPRVGSRVRQALRSVQTPALPRVSSSCLPSQPLLRWRA